MIWPESVYKLNTLTETVYTLLYTFKSAMFQYNKLKAVFFITGLKEVHSFSWYNLMCKLTVKWGNREDKICKFCRKFKNWSSRKLMSKGWNCKNPTHSNLNPKPQKIHCLYRIDSVETWPYLQCDAVFNEKSNLDVHLIQIVFKLLVGFYLLHYMLFHALKLCKKIWNSNPFLNMKTSSS